MLQLSDFRCKHNVALYGAVIIGQIKGTHFKRRYLDCDLLIGQVEYIQLLDVDV